MSFTLHSTVNIPEINSVARYYTHDGTGARLLSLSNNDENKCFGINFRTPTDDSSGIAHILEHSVLCGSEKYPVKEPFVEIIKSSLQTFVNAFTYPDKTCYPCASTNLQDFYNLIDIYLDAVFYPNITELTFRQEGWHFEIENLDAPLEYKGVVFNEMKGAYSSPDDLLGDRSRNSLFPDNTYQYDSGGDPLVMPSLTYAKFRRFHADYYHPSNSYIYFYGDDPEDKRLRLLDEVLSRFSRNDVDSAIQPQPNFTAPRTLEYPYDSGESEEAKHHVTLNWKMTPATDLRSSLLFSIIDHLLMGTAAAPMKRALLESGLGEEIVGGFDDHLRESIFTIGLKGIEEGNSEKVEALILDTLNKVVTEKLDPESVKATLNTIEFHLREQNSGRFPRGLVLMLSALSTWIYDGDPIEAISYEIALQEAKSFCSQPGNLEGLIKEWFVQNPHRSTVRLIPDENEGKRRQEIETSRLAEIKASLSEDQIRQVMADAAELKAHQDAPDSEEALATIPALSVDDLDRKIKQINTTVHKVGGIVCHHQELATNGIAYIDFGFDLHTLPQRLIPYLGLISKLLTELGTENYDLTRLTQKIGQDTGGIRATTFISTVYGKPGTEAAYLFIKGKALLPQTQAMLALMQEMILRPNLNQKDRIAKIVTERRSSLESGLIPGGSNVIHSRLKAHYTTADRISEEIGGIEQILFLRALSNRIETDWPGVLADLQQVFSTLFITSSAIANITADAAAWAQFEPQLATFLGSIASKKVSVEAWKFSALPKIEMLTLPSQVNFVGCALDLFQAGYQLHGSINVINNYLQTTHLWEKVRVQGGAYGGFSAFDPISGVFDYLSYRDPNTLKTIDTYDQTGTFLKELNITQSELGKAIIGTIGDLDAYLLPDAKGWQAFSRMLIGLTPELRQTRRDEIFACQPSHFKDLGQILDDARDSAHVAILGSSASLGSITSVKGQPAITTKIL